MNEDIMSRYWNMVNQDILDKESFYKLEKILDPK